MNEVADPSKTKVVRKMECSVFSIISQSNLDILLRRIEKICGFVNEFQDFFFEFQPKSCGGIPNCAS